MSGRTLLLTRVSTAVKQQAGPALITDAKREEQREAGGSPRAEACRLPRL